MRALGTRPKESCKVATASFHSFDDNWQTLRPTISDRTKFIFNNELLSDVKFVVPASYNEESESPEDPKSRKCMIPAHKFVLAISSPVYYAMFYGEMAETADTIQLPDCDYESLLELFRFLYSDEVNLSGSNVMQVLQLIRSRRNWPWGRLLDLLAGSEINVFIWAPSGVASRGKIFT